jgi:hypothetical protein
VARQVLDPRRRRARAAVAGELDAADGARAGLGDEHGILLGGQRDAVGEAEAVEDRVDVAARRAPEETARAGVLDEVALPVLDRPHPAGVREPDGAVGGDGRVVGEEEALAVDLAEQGLEVAGDRVEGEQPAVRVADEDAPVGEVLEAERPAARGCDRGGGPRQRVVHVEAPVGRAGPHPPVLGDEHVLGAGPGDGDHGERKRHP